MSDERRGYLYGLIAYGIWGFFPIYFKLLRPAGALEILAHRVIWSVVFVSLLLIAMRNWRFLARILRSPRLLGGITLAARADRASTGAPTSTASTRRGSSRRRSATSSPRWSSCCSASPCSGNGCGRGSGSRSASARSRSAVLTVDYGRLPYIALLLAGSFGSYSLVKKRLALPPAEGLFVESSVLAVPGTGLHRSGWPRPAHAKFGHVSAGHTR